MTIDVQVVIHKLPSPSNAIARSPGMHLTPSTMIFRSAFFVPEPPRAEAGKRCSGASAEVGPKLQRLPSRSKATSLPAVDAIETASTGVPLASRSEEGTPSRAAASVPLTAHSLLLDGTIL